MPGSLQRIGAIAGKEFRQLLRDRPTFGMIVGIPLLQIVLFGFAINLDVRHIHAGVADLADTQLSRQFIAAAQASQLVDVIVRAESAKELEKLMQRGAITVGIYLPHDFERRINDPERPAGQILIDNSGPGIDNIASRLAEIPLAPLEKNHAPAYTKKTSMAVRTYYNPERSTPVQIVPALIGVILNLSMVLFTAIAIVRERERGNLELLITTPIRTPELMLGKIIPYILIGLIQVTLIILVARGLFQVNIIGSIIDLYLAALLFIAALLTLGLLISTVTRNQFQAMQLTVFTFLPSILLSGFMFPFEGMPRFAQQLAELLPLTHFVRLVRGIVLRGAELMDMQSEMQVLGIFFLLFMVLAILRFRKRLD